MTERTETTHKVPRWAIALGMIYLTWFAALRRLCGIVNYHRFMWQYRREAWCQYRIAMQANKRNAKLKWLNQRNVTNEH